MRLNSFCRASLLPLFIPVALLANPAFADDAGALLKLNAAGTESAAASQFIAQKSAALSTTQVRFATIDNSLLQPRMESVNLVTTEGEVVNYKVLTSLRDDDGTQTWIGSGGGTPVIDTLTGEQKPDPLNSATLVFKEGRLNGVFQRDGEEYHLFSVKGVEGQVAIVKLNRNIENEGVEVDASGTASGNGSATTTANNSPAITCSPEGSYVDPTGERTTINVAIVTTNQSRAELSAEDIDAQMKLVFTQINQAAANSNVRINFQPAGILAADFDETTANGELLAAMKESSGTTLGKQIAAYRAQTGADLVVMLGSTPTSTWSTYNDATAETGLSVVKASGFTTSYNFIKALASNIGSSRDLDSYGGLPTKTPCYRYAYKLEPATPADNQSFRTLQSGKCLTGNWYCPQINYFSNPRLTYSNKPLGTVRFEDAARRLNERRDEVAAFYPPGSLPEAPGGECALYKAWDSTRLYAIYGEKVSYKDKIYQQNYQSINKPPDVNSAPWGQPWIYVKDCDKPIG